VPTISVVLPIGRVHPELASVIAEYVSAVARLGASFELILVPGPGGAAVSAVEELAAAHEQVHECPERAAGWGAAVRVGLASARGDILAYTNVTRTRADDLAEMLRYALQSPDVVLRANRRTRDSWRARLGSLLFNLECRSLLGIISRDVNGTPKVFPRQYDGLLALRRDDDLIDAEFVLVCERRGYPAIEVPIDATPLLGVTRAPSAIAALRLYAGVLTLRRERA
jgi:hypothetical protein